MALTLHGKAFETILVHMAVTDCAQRGVKAFGMCARQVLEVVRQLLFADWAYHEVPVIWHQFVCEYGELQASDRFKHQLFEGCVVSVREEKSPTLCASTRVTPRAWSRRSRRPSSR